MNIDIQPLNLPGVDAATRPLIISGPCSAETEEQVMATAAQLAQQGIHVFRAGVWKPRTRPGGFEGIGEEALVWLQRVHDELGMLTATEVATPAHIEAALAHGVDVLWIGARTTVNPFAMQEIADCLRGVDVPVMVKNPVNPDIDLWIGGLQRLNGAGVKRLAVIHRGFSNYDKRLYRNSPMWHIPIEFRRRLPQIPIIVDPSHIGGRRELVAPLCQQAMDLGFEGLMIESHNCPECAWSDASQQVTPDMLQSILSRLTIRAELMTTARLEELRGQIDLCDEALLQLLSQRMQICREIGQYKKENNMQIVHALRYTEILDKRSAQGTSAGLSPEFVRDVFEHIHEESVNQQIRVVNE